MRVLVVGGGGREHTLVWKLSQGQWVKKIYVAPGNAGMAGMAELVDIPADDIENLKQFALRMQIDLTVVGPEGPLTLGIVDKFKKEGLRIFGPSARAAYLEGSKVFAKEFMFKHGIPTAAAKIFDNQEDALRYLRQREEQSGVIQKLVVKADGLAAGKGVMVCGNIDEAEEAVKQIMGARLFGDAGEQVIIEECLEGEEASILTFVDGRTVVPMIPSQDHKQVFDHDKGPNTGGMGAYAPAPLVDARLMKKIKADILAPIMEALKKEKIKYKGILYVGLMMTRQGPKVLEFNCRFGDPETQVVLPLLKNDLEEVMEAVIEGKLGKIKIEWKDKAAVCVIVASGGYPGSYKKGIPIKGIRLAEALDEVTVFHAGTKLDSSKRIVTAGGRVLGVTALGNSVKLAINKAYKAVKLISFDGMHYRKDIGQKALRRLK